MKSKKTLIIFLVAFLLFIVAIQKIRPTGPVAEGKIAPDFTLEDMAGNRVSLDDYRGQIVILDCQIGSI